jgi:hypothetical protein
MGGNGIVDREPRAKAHVMDETAGHLAIPGPAAGPAGVGHWVRRVSIAAAAGALIGFAVAWIWQAAYRATSGSKALPIGPALAGLSAGMVVIAAGSAVCLVLLNAQPLALTIPLAVVLTVIELDAAARAVPGGSPPSAWIIAALTAQTLVVVLMTCLPGRRRIAGVALIAAVLAASAIAPAKVYAAITARDLARQMAALPFPVMAPRIPGYKIADAFPDGNSLEVDMVPTGARHDQWGTWTWDGRIGPAITVTIAPASTTDLDIHSTLANCHLVPPPRVWVPGERSPCRAIGGGLWIEGPPGYQEVIRRLGGAVVMASADSLPVMIAAATNLRRISISRLVSLDEATAG